MPLMLPRFFAAFAATLPRQPFTRAKSWPQPAGSTRYARCFAPLTLTPAKFVSSTPTTALPAFSPLSLRRDASSYRRYPYVTSTRAFVEIPFNIRRSPTF